MKGRQLAWIFGTFLALAGWTLAVPTEFICSIQETLGAGDYTNLATWETAINCALATNTTVTADWSNQNGGVIPDGSTVNWDSGGGTGTLRHVTTVAKSGRNAFLISGMKGTSLDLGNIVTFGPAAITNFTVASDTNSVVAVARIEGTWNNPDGALTILGWNPTTSTNCIRIYAVGDARHKGKWTATAHRLQAFGTVVNVRQGHVRLDGLQIKCAGTNPPTAQAYAVYMKDIDATAGGETKPYDEQISNCIIVGEPAQFGGAIGGLPYGIYHNLSGNTSLVWNSIIYGFNGGSNNAGTGRSGTGIWQHNGAIRVFNSIISDCSNSTYNVECCWNCAVFNIQSPAANVGFGATATNCASDYTKAGVVVTWTNKAAEWANVFVDCTNADLSLRNFHLLNYTGAGAIIGRALNAPAPALSLYADDIDGQPRGTEWDIGADEFVNTAPPVGTIITFR